MTMDHTVEAYLNRRSTGELLEFLDDCTHRALWPQYAQHIPLILQIIQSRGACVDTEIVNAWDGYCRNRNA